MNTKINILDSLIILFNGKITKEEKVKAESYIDSQLSDDYGEYLNKPPEYHDMVIKRMYRKTKYADESPERLRDILHEQITGQKRVS